MYVYIVPSPPTPEGRSLRSGRTIDTREFSGYYEYEEGERGGASPPVHEGDSDSDALIDEGWDTGSTASSDISDWANEAAPYNPSLSNNRTRKNRRRESTVSEIPSEVTIDEEERLRDREGGGGGGRVRRTVRSGVLLSSSTNTSSTTANNDTKPMETKHTVKKVRKGFDYSIYWPTDWLKMNSPQVSPYYPQVGDIVVYCYQGHIMYRDEVKKQRPYVWKNQLLPHQKYPQMRPQEYCLVNNVHFVVGPPTLCSITLSKYMYSNNCIQSIHDEYTFNGWV
ncbi:PREDICTED: bromodomain and WD repeat-containing protein 3-like [Amphimedon queenslandica]|uniref:BRWD/PHIP ancillary-like domain-containing protein n=1 Tax=Amphimedon queenslandica TaxID=400682 RepID=A0AAN0JWQ6_AMPQE|nr:PREDICTED: bromodomain and WD repeat-containing protein 3-like [Amphimedon queenslandica]|eukprot:XP_019861336.1 PREDICTED: bromodomain and WD repeat-containing protein 3-like [Amphimedon queenslandica]